MSSSSKLLYSLLLSTFLIISLTQSTTTSSNNNNVTSPNSPVVVTSQGTLTTATQPPQYNVSGLVQPLRFCLDGANNSFVSFGSSVGNFGTGNFTVAIWIQTTTSSPSLFDIIGNRFASGFGSYFQMRMAGANNQNLTEGAVIVEVCQNSTGFNYANIISHNTGLNDGNWHHLVFERSGTTMTLFVDGMTDNIVSTTGIADINSTTPFVVGRSVEPIAGTQFAPAACYEDIRVYNTSLNPDNVVILQENLPSSS